MNYYDVLGVSKDATDKEIKDAFNNMIKAFHPDMYRGSDKEFASRKTRELYEAYNVLKDPKKRKDYDSYIASGYSQDWYRADDSYDDERSSTEDEAHQEENEEGSREEGQQDEEPKQEAQHNEPQGAHSKEKPTKKGNVFKILIILSILIVAGAYAFNLFANSSPYAGTYEYYKLEVRDSEDNLVDTQDVYSSDVYSSITLNNDGTATSTLQDDYAEGTWDVDRTDGEYTMIHLDFAGDNSAAAISFLALFNDNNSALYGFEDEGLNYLFYYVKK